MVRRANAGLAHFLIFIWAYGQRMQAVLVGVVTAIAVLALAAGVLWVLVRRGPAERAPAVGLAMREPEPEREVVGYQSGDHAHALSAEDGHPSMFMTTVDACTCTCTQERCGGDRGGVRGEVDENVRDLAPYGPGWVAVNSTFQTRERHVPAAETAAAAAVAAGSLDVGAGGGRRAGRGPSRSTWVDE